MRGCGEERERKVAVGKGDDLRLLFNCLGWPL